MQKVAASCVWLASKLEESPRKSRQVIIVFHRMECRRENLPIEFLDLTSKVRIWISCYFMPWDVFLPLHFSPWVFVLSFASFFFLFTTKKKKKFAELKVELSRTERHILKEMGFVCHVEHPHKFISNYLATLETPPELRQEAWNLTNDRYFTQYNCFWNKFL